MEAFLFLLLLGASVKEPHAQLRSGCYSDSEPVATLEAGAPVTIRYSLAGAETACYKVAVDSGGKTIEGYLLATSIVRQGPARCSMAGYDAGDGIVPQPEWRHSSQQRTSRRRLQ